MKKKVEIFLDIENGKITVYTPNGIFTKKINPDILFSELQRAKEEIKRKLRSRELKDKVEREFKKLEMALLLSQTG